jgi:hypothetical protein
VEEWEVMAARRLGVMAILPLSLSACATPVETKYPDPVAAPEELLLNWPELPKLVWVVNVDFGNPGRWERIEWELIEPGRRLPAGETSECASGEVETFRAWHRDDGNPEPQWLPPYPEVQQFVCAFPSVRHAHVQFARTALEDVADGNFPNTEPGADPQDFRPPPLPASALRADGFDIGCLAGDSRDICGQWLYRGLYGRYIVQVFFRQTGGINNDSFLQLVRSIDAFVAEQLRRQ